MCDAVAHLLELRNRFRRNPEARACVDRALGLVAKASTEAPDMPALYREVDRLADDLALRFGRPRGVRVQ